MRSLFYSLLCFVTLIPVMVHGQQKIYSPLVDIPGNGPQSFEQYISFLYGASISIAALLAVVKIIIAGAKYMVSDVVPAKGDAILGLLLILGAVIILEFINPQLTKQTIQFQSLPQRPALSANASVSPVVTNTMATLMNGCGVREDVSTPELAIVTFYAATCPDSGAAIGAFTRACTGVVKYNVEKLIVVCSMAKNSLSTITPSPNGVFVYPLSQYVNSTLASAPYLTKNGAVWSLSPLPFCETYAASGLTATAKENLRNNCMQEAESDMEDFCENNAGKTSKTSSSYVCQLPVISQPYTKFEAEYLKNRAATDTTGFTVEIYRKLCGEMIPGAVLVDTDLDARFGVDDYRCVKY
jgi:hypothetical protein